MDDLKNIRILIVDDESMIRDVFMETLGLYGAICSEASNGKEAFDKILTEKFDLILSDVRMPVCSGVELLKMIQAHDGKTPQIMMMSGFSDLTDSKSKELGAIGLFMKPTQMSALIEAIKANI